jgi:hypothetical protein
MADVAVKDTRCQANSVGVWHEENALHESDQSQRCTGEKCKRTSVHLNAFKNHAFLTSIDRKEKIILILNARGFEVILCWQILYDNVTFQY